MGAQRRPSPRMGGVALAVWLVAIGGVLAACGEAEVSPSPASPGTPVTIDDGGFCRTDETAQARSVAFTAPVTLDRENGGTLDGTATVANVEEGTYTVDVECANGRISRSNFRVDSMPKGADTGIGPDGTNALQWAAGVLFVAGLAVFGFAVTRRRSDVRHNS